MVTRPLEFRRVGLSLALCGLLSARMGAADGTVVRPLDLIGGTAALVCDVQRPKAAWEEFRRGELFRRLQQFGPYQELLKSDGYRQWQETERTVTEATGASLSSQVLDLCSRELVLAVYLAGNNEPEGVLIARADNAANVERFLQSWQKLEPQAAVQRLTHRGQTFWLRPAGGAKNTSFYYVTFGDVFAVSNREARIKEVIELVQSSGREAKGPQRLVQQPVYRQTVPGPNEPAATVRVLLVARAWEQVWQDAAETDVGAAMLRRIWPAVDALTVDLRLTEGLHIEGRLHLNPDRVDAAWIAWTASTVNPQDFLATIPEDAVLAAAGGIHFEPLWVFARELASETDRAGWEQGRKLLRGLLGGRDLFDDILPALSHDVGLYLVPDLEQNRPFPFDGVLVFRFPPDKASTGLHLALDQALASALSLLSVQSAESRPDDEPATVHSEVSDGRILRWLHTSQPFRVACQVTPADLTVARTVETLRRHLAADSRAAKPSMFAAYRDKWFPEAGQFLCLDVRQFRERRTAAGAVLARPKDSGNGPPPRGWFRQAWELSDAVYLATRFEASKVTIRLGLTAEPAK